ncbi:ribonuclease P protein subunit p29 [Pseudomyrmex gracilis]|uniref:ribonuclease P protein subunit p29 n=1 Tax=Pseudomyrmex gracilis TaxID=219809 RepID=UPI000994928B|nr:ribonuclease P protein subunit p29 [Pseudomyrmex gracilis]
MTSNIKRLLCSPLPGYLTSGATVCENTEQHLLNFLQNLLPKSDCKSISDELRKTFIFSKFKVKHKQKHHSGKGKFSLSSVRKRMHFGLNKIGHNKSQIKYHDILALKQLWLDYIRNMLGIKSFTSLPEDPNSLSLENISKQLMKADFHGAEISVDSSTCPTLVGFRGIVIQDTKNTFKICGTDNVIRTIPKKSAKFSIYLDDGVVLKTFGKQLCVRPVERTSKKLKSTRLVQL